MVENNGEYGDMPDAKTLMPAGHSRIDCAVRMVMKGKGYVDLLSSYGTLRITPLAVDLFRICFAKGQCREFTKAAVTAAGELRCTVRRILSWRKLPRDMLRFAWVNRREQ